jgi:putative transposase
MKYNPKIHHRRSIRLRGYDYSRAGAYFITICTHDRRHIFGQIKKGEMILNEYGEIAYNEWEKLTERWPHIELGAFQIMPNHTHGIIIIHDVPVGAPLAGAQNDGARNFGTPVSGTPEFRAPESGTPEFRAPESGTPEFRAPESGTPEFRAPARGAPTMRTQWAEKPMIGQIVGAYKSCTATGCLKIAQSKQPEIVLGRLWQRNFWECIIRDLESYDRISNYIINNPIKWEYDKFYCLK